MTQMDMKGEATNRELIERLRALKVELEASGRKYGKATVEMALEALATPSVTPPADGVSEPVVNGEAILKAVTDNMAGGTDDFPTINMVGLIGDLAELGRIAQPVRVTDAVHERADQLWQDLLPYMQVSEQAAGRHDVYADKVAALGFIEAALLPAEVTDAS